MTQNIAPAALPNPEALTIQIGGTSITYDGSTAQTVTIADGSMSAQWEHTVAVHEAGIWVLTATDGGRAKLEDRGIKITSLGS